MLAGLGAAAIWGGMYVVSKYVLETVPAFGLVWLRLTIGWVALGLVALATRAPLPARRDLPLMALLGAIGMLISMNAQFLGTKLSTAANGALITAATPAFLVLFARTLLGERLTRWRVGGLVLATAGVLATVALDPAAGLGVSLADGVGASWSGVFLGNALLVVAAVTWALYSALAAVAARRYPVLVVTLWATGFGALFTLPAAAELQSVELSVPVWLGVLYLGVVATAGAFYLWNKSIQLLGSGLPAVLFFAQPVVGGLLGALFLGESLGPGFFLGGALIAAGVLVIMSRP